MVQHLTIESVRVTEAAALAAYTCMGRGDIAAVDKASTGAMLDAINQLPIRGHVVIGERKMTQSLIIAKGMILGSGGQDIDIILNPVEGAASLARGGFNAMSVMAVSPQGGFCTLPVGYMKKLAVGPGLPHDLVSLEEEPLINLRELARAKRVPVSELVVCVLDRPRHEELIAKIRSAGACISLIPDGDVSGIIATALPRRGVDMYVGIGGTLEGLLAAAAFKCIGGTFLGQLVMDTPDQVQAAHDVGVTKLNQVYTQDDLVTDDVIFAATGISHGTIFKGIHNFAGGATTHSLLLRSVTGTVRRIETTHSFKRKEQGLKKVADASIRSQGLRG